jgi:hypothetical protein
MEIGHNISKRGEGLPEVEVEVGHNISYRGRGCLKWKWREGITFLKWGGLA